MKAIDSEIWMQVFQLLATAALPSDAGNLSRTAKPLIGDKGMSEPSDLKIMKEREAAFLNAIDEHHGIIHKICLSYCRNRADEEDLYQEIVYQLWKAYPSFKGDAAISTWMHAVALRSAILPFRRKKVRIEVHQVLAEQPSDDPHDHAFDDRLFGVFNRLSLIDRAVLVLTMEGFIAKEIGAILRLNKKAVVMRMSRIRGIIEKAKQK